MKKQLVLTSTNEETPAIPVAPPPRSKGPVFHFFSRSTTSDSSTPQLL